MAVPALAAAVPLVPHNYGHAGGPGVLPDLPVPVLHNVGGGPALDINNPNLFNNPYFMQHHQDELQNLAYRADLEPDQRLYNAQQHDYQRKDIALTNFVRNAYPAAGANPTPLEIRKRNNILNLIDQNDLLKIANNPVIFNEFVASKGYPAVAVIDSVNHRLGRLGALYRGHEIHGRDATFANDVQQFLLDRENVLTPLQRDLLATKSYYTRGDIQPVLDDLSVQGLALVGNGPANHHTKFVVRVHNLKQRYNTLLNNYATGALTAVQYKDGHNDILKEIRKLGKLYDAEGVATGMGATAINFNSHYDMLGQVGQDIKLFDGLIKRIHDLNGSGDKVLSKQLETDISTLLLQIQRGEISINDAYNELNVLGKIKSPYIVTHEYVPDAHGHRRKKRKILESATHLQAAKPAKGVKPIPLDKYIKEYIQHAQYGTRPSSVSDVNKKIHYGPNIKEFKPLTNEDVSSMLGEMQEGWILYSVHPHTGRFYKIDTKHVKPGYIYVMIKNSLNNNPKHTGGSFAYGPALRNILEDTKHEMPLESLREGRDKYYNMIHMIGKGPKEIDWRDQEQQLGGAIRWKDASDWFKQKGKLAWDNLKHGKAGDPSLPSPVTDYMRKETIGAGKDFVKSTIHEGNQFIKQEKQNAELIKRGFKNTFQKPKNFSSVVSGIGDMALGTAKLYSRPYIALAREGAVATDLVKKLPGINIGYAATKYALPPLAAIDAGVNAGRALDDGKYIDGIVGILDSAVGSQSLPVNLNTAARVVSGGLSTGQAIKQVIDKN